MKQSGIFNNDKYQEEIRIYREESKIEEIIR